MSGVAVGTLRTAVGSRAERVGRVDIVGWGAAAALGIFLFAVCAARTVHGAPGIDVAIFDQALWRLLDGHAHVTLMDRNVFGDHLAPVLAVFMGLYRIAATPLWLIGAQSLAVGLAVVPTRRLAEEYGLPRWTGTVAVALNGPLLMSALSDFHTSTMAVPALAWAVLAAKTDNRRMALWSSVAVLLCRTDLGLMLAAVAMLASAGRTRRVLLWAAGMGAVVTLGPTLVGVESVWHIHYSHLGTGMVDAALHPWRVVPAVLTLGAALSLVTWLMPVGFVVWRDRVALAAILFAGLPIMLMDAVWRHLPVWHYGGPIMPIVVAGAFRVLGRRTGPSGLDLRPLVGGLVAALLLVSPVSFFSPVIPNGATFWGAASAGPLTLAEIPEGLIGAHEVVSASHHYMRDFAQRDEVYAYPSPFFSRDPVLPELDDAIGRVDVVVVVPYWAHELAELGFTDIVFENEHVVVARRASPGSR